MNKKTDEKTVAASGTEAAGELTVKRNKTVDFIARIGCIVIAFFIWYYAAGSNNALIEDKFTSVPVEIVNGSDYSILSGNGAFIDVTVSGNTNSVIKLKKADIRAYVEIPEEAQSGKEKYEIKYELPHGLTVVNSTSSSLVVYLDNTTTLSVPVNCKVVDYMLESGYELDTNGISCDVRQINVTGPEAIVSEISCATIYADIGHVTRTVTCGGDVVLIGNNGEEITNNYISKDVSYVNVTIPVKKTVKVPVEVKYKWGNFNDGNCVVEVLPETVTVKGDESIVDNLKIEFEIDEKKITDAKGTSYEKSLQLPDGVQNVSGEESVTLKVMPRGFAIKVLPVSGIKMINQGDQTVSHGEIQAVTVMGEADAIAGISDVVATVDLTGLTGSALVPVSFSLPEKVFEINGPYTVSVTVSDVQ